jgi:hypothetical protein
LISLILRKYLSFLQEATVSLDICTGLGSDYARGFGGKYGIQTDRQDHSAVGWDYIEKTEKHGSQKGNALRLAWHDVACI